jgi:hypothetical protein
VKHILIILSFVCATQAHIFYWIGHEGTELNPTNIDTIRINEGDTLKFSMKPGNDAGEDDTLGLRWNMSQNLKPIYNWKYDYTDTTIDTFTFISGYYSDSSKHIASAGTYIISAGSIGLSPSFIRYGGSTIIVKDVKIAPIVDSIKINNTLTNSQTLNFTATSNQPSFNLSFYTTEIDSTNIIHNSLNSSKAQITSTIDSSYKFSKDIWYLFQSFNKKINSYTVNYSSNNQPETFDTLKFITSNDSLSDTISTIVHITWSQTAIGQRQALSPDFRLITRKPEGLVFNVQGKNIGYSAITGMHVKASGFYVQKGNIYRPRFEVK